jgi:hypothetical protein
VRTPARRRGDECAREGLHVGEARVGVLRQRPLDRGGERGRHVRAPGDERRRRLVEDALEDRARAPVPNGGVPASIS